MSGRFALEGNVSLHVCHCSAQQHFTSTAQRDGPLCDHPTFWCHLQQRNNLHHHGWQRHNNVDPDSDSKCDSCCASFEHAMMVRTSFTKRAVQQNTTFEFSRNCESRERPPHSVAHVATTLNCKKEPPTAGEVLNFNDRHLHTCAVKLTS